MTDNETDNEDEQRRALIRALFATDEPDETEQQKPPNYVAREGNISKPPPEAPMRVLLRKLNGN